MVRPLRARRPRAWFGVLLLLLAGSPAAVRPPAAAPVAVILHGGSAAQAAGAVQAAGGTVTQQFSSIPGVAAIVPAAALPGLRARGFQVTADAPAIQSADLPLGRIPDEATAEGAPTDQDPALLYPSMATGAALLHQDDINGQGVTVAVIDSGLPPMLQPWTQVTSTTLEYRVAGVARLVYRDFVAPGPVANSSDPYGHGTHVAATIGDGRKVPGGPNGWPLTPGAKSTLGLAPNVNLVVARALDGEGQAPYSRVIAAIDWIIANKTRYNISVLNLSLQAPIHGPYWHDPLAQAVMAAWAEGITVVVAAGNTGPAPATITVPGNVPYVITVGALKPGLYTASHHDELAYYSAAGPTESKFIKPDVVIAGSRVIAPLPTDSALVGAAGLAKERAQLDLGSMRSTQNLAYYYLSGTSMAAAEVSGIVALIKQQQPNLTNDQIKYRLTLTAETAMRAPDEPAYAIWQQGAGRVNVADAVLGISTAAANEGMDIALDRDHESGTHYMGSTAYDPATDTMYIDGEPVEGGSYQSWAGSYQSWAGSYQSWAGSYQSWAGNAPTWASGTSVWSSSYPSWSGSLPADPARQRLYLPAVTFRRR
ncbi:MAG TPA: S8 family peptidase [Herpetosiphonaceae bacterium]